MLHIGPVRSALQDNFSDIFGDVSCHPDAAGLHALFVGVAYVHEGPIAVAERSLERSRWRRLANLQIGCVKSLLRLRQVFLIFRLQFLLSIWLCAVEKTELIVNSLVRVSVKYDQALEKYFQAEGRQYDPRFNYRTESRMRG